MRSSQVQLFNTASHPVFYRLLIFLMVLAVAACSRNGDETTDKTVAGNQPDNFAAFINPLAGLASGDYVIEANTDAAGEAGDFTLTVSYDDGTSEDYLGNWTSDISSRTFSITRYAAGGIKITLQSVIENNLRLLNANGFVVASNGDATAGDSVISLASSRIDSAAYGAAYYAAIDPNNDKDTLQKWKDANGYAVAEAAGRVIQPRFRDTKDLGYGRGMRMWTRADGSLYFFVENFQVRSIPGQEYTSLNLDALLSNDRKHHFGSNAIEFSTFPYGPGEPCGFDSAASCAIADPNPPKFAKFYTFDATNGSQTVEDHANETRLDLVNLDGRGAKAMPGACVYCHGGTLRPLRADGSFRDNTLNGSAGNGLNGDVNAKLQLLEVPSFEYGDFSPYTRADQEPIIKQVNMAIYCSYPNLPADGIAKACAQFCVDPVNTSDCDGEGNSLEAIILCKDPADTVDCDGRGGDLATVLVSGNTVQGEWTGGFATEMTEGWYDDPDVAGLFDRATFNASYVPVSWQHDSSDNVPPPGSEQLFLEVVQPVCFVCHSRRGTDLGSNSAIGVSKDIDFSSYEKFISHAEQIKQYVFDRGVMPLSLRGYNAFWAEDSNAPEVLAAYLDGVLPADKKVALNSNNKVDEPGEPIADAGPDRTTTSPVRLFGSNSRYVDRYSWRITSAPSGSDAVLTEINTSRPLLTASISGDYEVTLAAAYGSKVVSDTVHIKIDNSLTELTSPPDPKTITFDSNIRSIFSTAQNPLNSSESDTKACQDCHQQAGSADAIAGVPVYWGDVQPATGDTATNAFYREVLSRVDFNDPENSLLLKKPSNNHHFGGLREGFEVDNPANRQNYDLILNWILEGAPEN